MALCLDKPAWINGVIMTDMETMGCQPTSCMATEYTTAPWDVCRECAGSPSTLYCVWPDLLGALHRCPGARM